MGRARTVAGIVRGLAQGRANRGWCPACASRTVFVETGPWLRDEYRCVRCLSIPRWRGLIAVLDQVAPAWSSLKVYEPSPGGAASRRLRRELARGPGSYTTSHYFDGVPRGDLRDGIRSEDLECLTFPDDSFDLVITQDVFEHVLDPPRAFAEVARVLRRDGLHVWTVPYRADRNRSTPRARRDERGELVLLAEPEYHNDPVDPDGALVVTDWGPDLPDLVQKWSGLPTRIVALKDRARGLDGEYPEVFVSGHAGMSAEIR